MIELADSEIMNGEKKYFDTKKPVRKPVVKSQAEAKPFFVTSRGGIGGAIYMGLGAIHQIAESREEAWGRIDVLCNNTQAELYSHDPRIRQIIIAEDSLFPSKVSDLLKRFILTDEKTKKLQEELEAQDYQIIFPGNLALGFLRKIKGEGKIILPGPKDLYGILEDYWTIRRFGDAPASRRARNIVSNYFSSDRVDDCPPLYLDSANLEKAIADTKRIKSELGIPEDSKIITIAPDTASKITRPPTELLTKSVVEGAYFKKDSLLIYILPSYTDKDASTNLTRQLEAHFPGHIKELSKEDYSSLLDVAGLIDHSDILITGDTGIAHLGSAHYALHPEDKGIQPRNRTQEFVVFGGTNPGLYSPKYNSKQVEIIGRGRPVQKKLKPGFFKDEVTPTEDYFDHIDRDKFGRQLGFALN